MTNHEVEELAEAREQEAEAREVAAAPASGYAPGKAPWLKDADLAVTRERLDDGDTQIVYTHVPTGATGTGFSLAGAYKAMLRDHYRITR